MTRTALSILWLIAGTAWGQVSFDRILAAGNEPQNWLTYSGSTMSQRYTTLSQITPQNVKNLELQWMFQARSLEKFEATPLVVDGILYTVQAPNNVQAAQCLNYLRASGKSVCLLVNFEKPKVEWRRVVSGVHT